MTKNIYNEAFAAIAGGKKANIVSRLRQQKGIVGKELVKELATEGQGFESRPKVLHCEDGVIFREPVAAKERLIILGGGHIALSLCEFAAKTGFAVTVVDDRPEFADLARFPWAKAIVCEGFAPALERLAIGEADYVAVVTRGHRHDTDCLGILLKGRMPHYVGMIGSRTKIATCFSTLGRQGYQREQLQKIHTPIGIDIGAVLPEEIAVSILAELIACKRNHDRSTISTDLDMEVVEHLARLKEPSVVITVMKSNGSTPRGAGAKMVVDRHGKVRGSIGGGRAEGDAVTLAGRMIDTGQYQVVKVDLTGDTAEANGMVCGGTMEILIEDFGSELTGD